MPTIADYYARYRDLTKTASEVARQLNFAGLGVIWIFRAGAEGAGSAKLPSDLLIPIVWIVASLTIDLLQYFVGGLIWRFYARHLERLEREAKQKGKAIKLDHDYRHPKILPAIMETFLYAKLVSLGIAYFLIARYLMKHLFG